MWKSLFSIDILIKNSQGFLGNFQSFLHFWSKPARFFREVHYLFLLDGNHSSNLDYLEFWNKFQPIFFKNFKNFHPISTSPSLSKQSFDLFWYFSNSILEFLWLYRVLQKKWNFINKISKELRKSCKIWQEKCWYFWKMDYFLIICFVLKNYTWPPSRGRLYPDPQRGVRDSL